MSLVPRLRLGTTCAQGSALRLDAQQAEPADLCVPRQEPGNEQLVRPTGRAYAATSRDRIR